MVLQTPEANCSPTDFTFAAGTEQVVRPAFPHRTGYTLPWTPQGPTELAPGRKYLNKTTHLHGRPGDDTLPAVRTAVTHR